MREYLTIDIGGTFVKYSVMDEAYGRKAEGSVSTKKVPAEFLEQIKQTIEPFRNQISGIAVCMAGFIDSRTGENTDFSVGENFKAYNLKKVLEEEFLLPVLLENDCNCAALGEMVQGAGRGCRDFGLITFGTGIGGAVVIDGKLHRGRNFKAGEVGFTRTGIATDQTAESAEGTAGLAKKVSSLLGKEVSGGYVMEHLTEDAIHLVYQEWLKKAAYVVGNMAVTLDPEKILIGGGISENPVFIQDLKAAVYDIFYHLKEYTQIVPCEQGNAAGRIGALYLLLQQVNGGKR